MSNEMETKFDKMGARAKVYNVGAPLASHRDWNGGRRFGRELAAIRVDIRRDEHGEFFDVRHRNDVTVEVIDVKRADRHLLLMARQTNDHGGETKSKFLCGHDERSWFVAAIPEEANARDVQGAKDALKPPEVWASIHEHKLARNKRDLRRNDAFIRQGEWFFIPRPRVTVKPDLVIKNEPIRRGAGKPHMCQFLHRTGGEQVYVSGGYPNGLTTQEYRDLPQQERRHWSWRPMVRNAHVYVKGAIRHPDHKTVWLSFWHEVVMNTETKASAMQHVAFLD
jgi:hypothetical protein